MSWGQLCISMVTAMVVVVEDMGIHMEELPMEVPTVMPMMQSMETIMDMLMKLLTRRTSM